MPAKRSLSRQYTDNELLSLESEPLDELVSTGFFVLEEEDEEAKTLRCFPHKLGAVLYYCNSLDVPPEDHPEEATQLLAPSDFQLSDLRRSIRQNRTDAGTTMLSSILPDTVSIDDYWAGFVLGVRDTLAEAIDCFAESVCEHLYWEHRGEEEWNAESDPSVQQFDEHIEFVLWSLGSFK